MLSRLKSKLRSLGWSDTAFFVAALIVKRASFGSARLIKYYFVAQPVLQRADSSVRGGTSMHLYVSTGADTVITQAPRPTSVFHERFAQGARCVVAQRDGELAGFIWLCPRSYREDEVRCVYKWTPSQAAMWDFDVYIAPQFRMGRLFVRLWEKAHSLIRAEGVAWTISRVDAFNAGSLAAHRKLGARTLGRGWFLIAGRMQFAILSLAPFWHFSVTGSDPARICFDLSALGEPPLQTYTGPG